MAFLCENLVFLMVWFGPREQPRPRAASSAPQRSMDRSVPAVLGRGPGRAHEFGDELRRVTVQQGLPGLGQAVGQAVRPSGKGEVKR